MNQQYSPGMRERALRMLDETKASGEHPNLTTAVRHVAGLLGVSPETLRVWHRRRGIDTGQLPGVLTEMIRFLDEHRERFGGVRCGTVEEGAHHQESSRADSPEGPREQGTSPHPRRTGCGSRTSPMPPHGQGLAMPCS